MALTTGYQLAQRYRLGRRIAVGGMGEVWEAEDTRLGRRVAIKVLKPELTGDPEFRQRFRTEAQLTASLNHPGIAGVHDYGEASTDQGGPGRYGHPEADVAYLVMELVDGDSLANVLSRQRRLSPDQTMDILGQAADALQAAHERGLVHRDVKPGNILITPNGRVKLTDFGIAKAVDAAPVTRQGMVMGTAHYIAPEQAAGDEAGPASDVYSLGVVGFECLAGERPFHSENPLTIAMMHVSEPPPPLPSDVPPPVRALIDATLVKDPTQRYRTGGEFASAVAAVRSGRRPVMPAGMDPATVAAMTVPMGEQGPPRTALMPPGTGYEPDHPPAPEPTRVGAYPGAYPAGRAGDDYQGDHRGDYRDDYGDDRYRDEPGRRRSTRTAIAVALVAVAALILGVYALRDGLTSGTAQPGSSSVAAPPPAVAPTTQQQPQQQPVAAPPPPTSADNSGQGSGQPQEQQTTTTSADQQDQVFVISTEYVGKSGKAAAARAERKGLQPKVVDEQGNEIDSDKWSDCQVTKVDPAAGFVPAGSDLTLTCGASG